MHGSVGNPDSSQILILPGFKSGLTSNVVVSLSQKSQITNGFTVLDFREIQITEACFNKNLLRFINAFIQVFPRRSYLNGVDNVFLHQFLNKRNWQKKFSMKHTHTHTNIQIHICIYIYIYIYVSIYIHIYAYI